VEEYRRPTGNLLENMDRLRHTGRLRAALLATIAGVLFVLPSVPAAARPAVPRQDPGTTSTTQEGTGAVDPAGDNPQLGKEYNDTLAELARLQTTLDTTQLEARMAQAKLATLRTQTRDTQIKLLSAQDRYKKAVAASKLRQLALRQAEARVARGVERLRRQAVASFVRGGETSVMEAFLAARNGKEAGQALAYGNAAIGSTDQLVRSLRHSRAIQRKAAKAAAKAKQQATDTRIQIENATKFLVAARDRQVKLVHQVDLKVLAVNQALLQVQTRVLLTGSAAAGSHIDSIGGLLAGIQAGEPDFQVGAVDISTPLPGHSPSSPFGLRFHPILHIWRLHAGCDIGAPTGLAIHAPADGIVVIAGTHGGYGNYTAIDHGNSLATGYGHQSQILVHVGQVVKKGDIIGLVGSTGLSTGAHLHFETRIKGVPVNPEGIVDFKAPVPYGP
jgi:murein DD-endopeptidase MepM/ murein hydrolase activator NlpD